jgi:predicted transposase/invertase (TIGR01784 family)
LEVIPENADFEELKEAYEEANQFNWQPDELEYYENVGIKIQDERGAISLALKEGLERGLEQGLKNKALETARKMLADGLDLALVAKYTGLSPDELAELS